METHAFSRLNPHRSGARAWRRRRFQHQMTARSSKVGDLYGNRTGVSVVREGPRTLRTTRDGFKIITYAGDALAHPVRFGWLYWTNFGPVNMPRTLNERRTQDSTARVQLETRTKPCWRALSEAVHIGYRCGKKGPDARATCRPALPSMSATPSARPTKSANPMGATPCRMRFGRLSAYSPAIV